MLSPEEIKKTVDFLFSIVEFLMDDKRSAETKIVDINDRINEVHKEISSIRAKCHHTYIGKTGNMMGRGTCEICGDSDY